MKIGIICASDSELAPFLPHIREHETNHIAMLNFHCGKIEYTDIIAVYSGVCKVNAAIACQILIDKFNVDTLINSGAAGAISTELKVFDTVISTATAYHDVADDILTEFHPYMASVYFHSDNKLLQAAKQINFKNYNIHFGRCVTGEAFITNNGRKKIIQKFNPLSIAMETASIAHVCYVNKVPFISIRTITDTPDKCGVKEFDANCDSASEISKNITLAIIRKFCEMA